MAINRTLCRTGMRVVGSDGSDIGQVKECRENDFLISRAMQRDIYCPFDAVQNMAGDVVTLNIPSDQVDNMGWMSPPVSGGMPGQQQQRS